MTKDRQREKERGRDGGGREERKGKERELGRAKYENLCMRPLSRRILTNHICPYSLDVAD